MEQPSFGYLFLKTAGVLICLIVFMVIVVFFLKRYFPRFVGQYGRESHIRIVERRLITSRHSIVLMEIDGVRLIVGIGPQNIVFFDKNPVQYGMSQSENDAEVKS